MWKCLVECLVYNIFLVIWELNLSIFFEGNKLREKVDIGVWFVWWEFEWF